VARQSLPLAVEQVNLRLHEHGTPGHRHQARPGLRDLPGVGALVRDAGADPLGRLRPLLLVPGGFGPGLPDEHVDLDQLAVERGQVGVEPGTQGDPRGLG
jgi:hypothetical protein